MSSNSTPRTRGPAAPSDTSVAARLAFARALGSLIALLRTSVTAESAAEHRDRVRRALRATVGAGRQSALEIRVEPTVLLLGDHELPKGSPARDAAIELLVDRLAAHGSATLDVRRGAAPGELLALARVLGTTPDENEDRSQWRSWSVRITPQSVPRLSPPDTLAAVSDDEIPDAVQHEISALEASGDEAEVEAVVSNLVRLVTSPPWDTAAAAVEAAALALVHDARRRGARAGRLAVEGGLRQLLSPAVINLLVERLPVSRHRDALMPVLARGGDHSVNALVALLQLAPGLSERRVCFDAIVALDAGDDALREALQDDRWFVVRNAAALLGEMGVVEADGALLSLLEHDDERLRIAGARALTRLGTERALVALQSMMSDAQPELRRLAAAAHGARSLGKPSTTALLNALDIEPEEDVILEIVSVLGALGSPDGVQRLVRLLKNESGNAEPWLREAAYNALVVARGESVIRKLEGG